ncbi:C45 family autoproteolytic acyltransferase/hydolase [Shewanella violacea]|uniref:Uncharacterized protein n=1 Tax=Shewanella violacea (strain JCM 10179 / CIP 106290 / LMG 19151 / DSS12) TaxID=637905 RepID=D4ZJT7_SHEVD|nr:C45 family autoproteolytic acyltransferase/hydolase [Shewanella violacea]BAJ01936.1 hypothetical protein SVI_1965 [Shewanella violacea DSS12]
MKKITLCAALLATAFASNASMIQHTDNITEVQFKGSSYELGKYVGVVAKEQILDSIDRYDATLGLMLEGLNVIAISKYLESNKIFQRIQAATPDGAAYISGLADSLNRTPELLLSVAMSDEAILVSQANGGIGFLQSQKSGYNPAAPAKCTVFAQNQGKGYAMGGANFDYMAANYKGLIILKHTGLDGKTRVIQTWAGLIPFGGITKGGQMMLVNTNATEGTARQKAGGEIMGEGVTPSFYLSWEAFNIEKSSDMIDVFKAHNKYSAFFSHTVTNGQGEVLNVENGYPDTVNYSYGSERAHANHSLYKDYDFLDAAFASGSLKRQRAADSFLGHNSKFTLEQAQDFLGSDNVWKGRGPMVGTVTATVFSVTPEKTTMMIQTDEVGSGHRYLSFDNSPVQAE